MPWQPPFSEKDLRAAISQAVCWADALRFLGYAVHREEGQVVEGRGGAWESFIFFQDPDGNNWAVQETPTT
jgi:hypothetical protein